MVANASNAFRRGDFPQAEQRWRAVLACHGKAAIGYVGLASALQKQQRPDNYEAVLREGMAALPGNRHLMERFAAAATQRGDWAEAAQRWRRYVLRFPQDGTGHQQLGVALKQLGRLEEADHALGAGLALVPGCLPLALEHAWCAQAANNWAEALRPCACAFPTTWQPRRDC
jgi:Flp pilus assembly protein TadD